MWWIIDADKVVQDEERLLLHYLTVSAERSAGNSEEYQRYIELFKNQIEIDEDDLWARISGISEDGATNLYRAAIHAAAVEGKISKQRLELLELLAGRLGLEHDETLINKIERMVYLIQPRPPPVTAYPPASLCQREEKFLQLLCV
ncbi:hypothetical protein SAMN05421878_1141 [Actinobaculum suis]|uniref:Co-chaperone DjlA N-terminal domain-containing protein n=1 Tax=Actinobaculum suis TaxID=1657 RepID=A0A1G7DZ50_9ACTO|nr:hypothetical protein [Actinobaculum suis]MDY5153250.1 hypothetical protein [Actinobaculum suis]SDE56753.1 hypothetical protein SAMN05421878_1141 [Actinobaculum suis]